MMTSQNKTVDEPSDQTLAISSQMETLTLSAGISSTSPSTTSSTLSSTSKAGCLCLSPSTLHRASSVQDFAKLMHRLDLILGMMERFTAAYRHNACEAGLPLEKIGLQQPQQQEVEVFLTIGGPDGVLVEVGNGSFVVREHGHLLFAHDFKTVRLGTEAEYRTGFADMLYASGASSVSFSERLRRGFWA